MIEELRIRNLALIEKAEMRFSDGFTALTGETGAGKTALLGGIKLAMGARAESSIVREGCDEAVVEAVFSLDEAASVLLEEKGFAAEDGLAIAKRRVRADGRSRCYVNDEAASVKGLASAIEPLVDLHGQHEQQALLSPQTHVDYLDRWAGERVSGAKAAYADAFASWREARAAFDEAVERASASEYQIEQARFVCSQIDPVNPGENEHDELEARLPILRNGENLATAAADALSQLRGEGGAIDALSAAGQTLERASGTDPQLDSLAERLADQLAALEDAALDLRSYRDEVEFDPVALERAMDRLGQLDGLVRRFGPTYEAMLERWHQSREILESVDSGSSAMQQLEEAASQAESQLRQAAAALAEARTHAASEFCDELSHSVAELAMSGSTFEMKETELDLASWTRSGSRKYELLYAPAAGMTPRPLAKIASGGELSRVMLAIECMGEMEASRKTMVFDEVDAGIGGAAANSVADKLVELSKRHQVVVVTHLAQIAARADNHLLVSKNASDGMPSTTIAPIEGDDRVAEIARMLSGTADATALEHARAMLGEA